MNDTSQERVDETSKNVHKPCGLECDCTDVCKQVDYKALWQQMCERCDELDKRLSQSEQAPMHYYRADAEGNLERIDIHSAQPEQEPVAWWIPKYKAPDMVSKVRWSDECEPLYTTPPQRAWVEIDGDDWIKALELADFDKVAAFEFFENKLKELNT